MPGQARERVSILKKERLILAVADRIAATVQGPASPLRRQKKKRANPLILLSSLRLFSSDQALDDFGWGFSVSCESLDDVGVLGIAELEADGFVIASGIVLVVGVPT